MAAGRHEVENTNKTRIPLAGSADAAAAAAGDSAAPRHMHDTLGSTSARREVAVAAQRDRLPRGVAELLVARC